MKIGEKLIYVAVGIVATLGFQKASKSPRVRKFVKEKIDQGQELIENWTKETAVEVIPEGEEKIPTSE